MPVITYLARKYGPQAAESAKSKSGHLHQLAAKLGIEFDSNRIISSTIKSHCLVDYASSFGVQKQNELVEVLFRGYFADGRLISSNEFLLEAAEKVGLNRAEAESHIDSTAVQARVRGEVDEGRSDYGVNGVPHFIISNQSEPNKQPYSFSGAQPPETFTSVFERLL
eukprot:scpid82829/ scgid5843/ 